MEKENNTSLNPSSWRRQWHPTPVLLPGKSHEWRSLVGCSPWGRKELDMTERLHFHSSLSCIEEGNGNPFQCSCLENPRDKGAWWLLSMGSHRVGHDWSDLAAAAANKYFRSLNAYCNRTVIITFRMVFWSLWASLVAQTIKNLPANQETWVLIPGSGRSSGEGNGNPLQYSCLENSMDRGAWLAIVHRITKRHNWATNT